VGRRAGGRRSGARRGSRHPEHANSLAGNACVDDQIAAYLADGTLPARPGNRPDAICAPLPQPVPSSQAASAVAAANSGVAARLPQILAQS
jgi:hypothetical protein